MRTSQDNICLSPSDVPQALSSATGTIYQGQLPVIQFDMDASGYGAVQSFKLFDQFGAVIATDVSTTSQQPVPGQQLSTWQLNHLDGSALTDTKSWKITAFAFAGNTFSTAVSINSGRYGLVSGFFQGSSSIEDLQRGDEDRF